MSTRESNLDDDQDAKAHCLTLRNPYLTKDYLGERREADELVYHVLDTIRIETALNIDYLPIQLRMIMSETDFLAQDVSDVDPWVLLSSGRAMLLGVNGDFLSQFGGMYHWDRVDRQRWEESWSARYRWGNYSSKPIEEQLFLRVLMDEATYMIQEDFLSTSGPITGCVIGLPIIVAYPLP